MVVGWTRHAAIGFRSLARSASVGMGRSGVLNEPSSAFRRWLPTRARARVRLTWPRRPRVPRSRAKRDSMPPAFLVPSSSSRRAWAAAWRWFGLVAPTTRASTGGERGRIAAIGPPAHEAHAAVRGWTRAQPQSDRNLRDVFLSDLRRVLLHTWLTQYWSARAARFPANKWLAALPWRRSRRLLPRRDAPDGRRRRGCHRPARRAVGLPIAALATSSDAILARRSPPAS